MPRVRVDQYHPIICKTCLLNGGVFSVARGGNRFLQHPVHLSEIEVAEHWRNHPALRNALLPSRFQNHLEQPHHCRILYPPRYLFKQQIMLHVIQGHRHTLPIFNTFPNVSPSRARIIRFTGNRSRSFAWRACLPACSLCLSCQMEVSRWFPPSGLTSILRHLFRQAWSCWVRSSTYSIYAASTLSSAAPRMSR